VYFFGLYNYLRLTVACKQLCSLSPEFEVIRYIPFWEISFTFPEYMYSRLALFAVWLHILPSYHTLVQIIVQYTLCQHFPIFLKG
jgi:hypothetical protein